MTPPNQRGAKNTPAYKQNVLSYADQLYNARSPTTIWHHAQVWDMFKDEWAITPKILGEHTCEAAHYKLMQPL